MIGDFYNPVGCFQSANLCSTLAAANVLTDICSIKEAVATKMATRFFSSGVGPYTSFLLLLPPSRYSGREAYLLQLEIRQVDE